MQRVIKVGFTQALWSLCLPEGSSVQLFMAGSDKCSDEQEPCQKMDDVEV
jgi:hypothetical protein